ncbi:Leucine-rich repeat [Sesbania bispinosa]|nr:Leucine-rich repeat [Sesbania bispinosa]
MQLLHSDETAPEPRDIPPKPDELKTPSDSSEPGLDEGVVLDISGKNLEFSASEKVEDSAESLYMYKNLYSLIPKSVGGLMRLRTIKFFGNEINLFAPEFENMTRLECLQMKISSPGIGGLPFHKLKGLKELELSKGPPRPSAFPILTEIAALKCLTKLSICHFSIRFLPPEIGCLKNLEYLDLSFNKMKTLPSEISFLIGLVSMKVANNKLVELPSAMTSLSRLESLDLSNNRLTSLGSLELGSMHRLQKLNLQCLTWRDRIEGASVHPSTTSCPAFFKFLHGCAVIWKEMMGGRCKDDCNSSSVEMDVYESSLQEDDETHSHGPHNTSSSILTSSSSSRCFAARKSGKRWKRRHYLQQKARQERLNNSRKWKGVDHDQLLSKKVHRISEPENLDSLASENCKETVPDNGSLDDNNEEAVNDNLVDNVNNDEVIIEKEDCGTAESKHEKDASLCSLKNAQSEPDEASCSDFLKCISKSKRHSDRDLDNPKPCKSRKPIGDDISLLSCKYSEISFCGIEDHLSDGFYDAGRDRPFMPLESYEQNQCLASREVILLDRRRDEELDAVVLSAQALIYNLKQLNGFKHSWEPGCG